MVLQVVENEVRKGWVEEDLEKGRKKMYRRLFELRKLGNLLRGIGLEDDGALLLLCWRWRKLKVEERGRGG